TRGVFVVVAGDDCNCFGGSGQRSRDTDTWEFDGEAWQQIDPVPAPTTSGAVRWEALATAPAMRDHRMTSVPGGGVIVVGDATIDGTDDIREPLYLYRRGRFFRSVDIEGPFAAEGSSPSLAGLTTADDGTIFVFGGGTGATPSSSERLMRRIDGATTTVACTGPAACAAQMPVSPFAPYGHAMIHDGTSVLMFGGLRTVIGMNDGFRLAAAATNELFAWSTSSGWQQRCTGGQACGDVPSPRVRAVMVPTAVAGEVLVYGGALSNGGLDAATYLYDGERFERFEVDAAGPVARQEHVLVFDDERGAPWLTSGIAENRFVDTRGVSPTRVLEPALDIVWEWVDGAWHAARVADVEGDGRPAQRSGTAASRDVDGGVVVHGGTRFEERIVGGFASSGAGRLDDTWRWQGGADTRPAQRFSARTIVAGIVDVDEDLGGADVRWYGAASDGDGDVPVELLVWLGTHYAPLTTTSCGVGCNAAVIDAVTLRQAIVGGAREVVVVAAPLAVNGLAPHYAHIETDYVEVRVRYRR
ncbi:MAG TPA: hypothetical protein VGF99_06050, partial [Myxococcota bacterium]